MFIRHCADRKKNKLLFRSETMLFLFEVNGRCKEKKQSSSLPASDHKMVSFSFRNPIDKLNFFSVRYDKVFGVSMLAGKKKVKYIFI